MGQDHLDHPNVDAERYGACTLIRPRAPVFNQFVTFEVPDLFFAEIAHQCRKGSRLIASGWFPYRAHIGYMKVDQVTKGVQPCRRRSLGGEPLIDLGLGLSGPFLGVIAAQEGFAGTAALPSDLDPVGTGGKLGDRGHFRVRYVCIESSQGGIFGDTWA